MPSKRCRHPDGCTNPHYAKGWCRAHYNRVRKDGHPGPVETGQRPARRCTVVDRHGHRCEGTVHARDVCVGHHQRLLKHGDVQADIPLVGQRATTCTHPGGCTDPVLAKELCTRHYAWLAKHGEIGPLNPTGGRTKCAEEGCEERPTGRKHRCDLHWAERRARANRGPADRTTRLTETDPDLAGEWHPTRNDRTPDQVSRASNMRVWWLCPTCGHEWKRAVDGRAHARSGCPACSGRIVRPDLSNALATRRPDLAAEWHPSLNGDRTPQTTTYGSGYKAWWTCPLCTHTYQTQVVARTDRGRGCPACAGRAIKPDRSNAAATRYPDLAPDWDADRNGRAYDTITYGSSTKRWWRCRVCDHTWQESVKARGGGYGCPACSGHQVHRDGSNSLAVTHPGVAAEWHPTRNATSPDRVRAGSATKVWWKCSIHGCRHEWETTPNNRTNEAGRGPTGCPSCSGTGRSAREIEVAFELAHFLPDIDPTAEPRVPGWRGAVDILIPSLRVVVEYDGVFWHGDRASATRERRKAKAIQAAGYQLLRVREEPLPPVGSHDVTVATGATIATIVDEVLEALGRMTGHVVQRPEAYSSRRHAITRRRARRHLAARKSGAYTTVACIACGTAHTTRRGDPQDRCDECRTRPRPPRRSVAAAHPHLVGEWHPRNDTTPEDVACSSKTKVWWRCGTCAHEWQVSPAGRHGCPHCAGHVVHSSGTGSLVDLHPRDADLWHPTRNSRDPATVRPGSGLKAWWQCPRCGYEWQQQVASRTASPTPCPAEAGRAIRPDASNSLAATHPDIAGEWAPTRNGTLTPLQVSRGARRQVWWRCPNCLTEYQQEVRRRTGTRDPGCPTCR